MPRKGENIRKRKDGRWEARYMKGRDMDGKIRYGYLYGKSYKEVKDKKIKIISEFPPFFSYGGQPSALPEDDRIRTVSIHWKNHIRYTVKESTYSNYGEILNNHILPVLGDMQIRKFTNRTLLNFVQQELERGMSYGSIHVIMGVLKNILRYGQEQGCLPAELLKFPRIPAGGKEIRIMSKEDFRKLDACLSEGTDPFTFGIFLCMYTGIRVGDADGKISLNQQKPSNHAGLRRFGPEKFLQRNNEFMKERPIFYKNPIKIEKDFSTWLRCFYYTTKAVITEYINF